MCKTKLAKSLILNLHEQDKLAEGISIGGLQKTCQYYSSGKISLIDAIEDSGLDKETLNKKTVEFGFSLPA